MIISDADKASLDARLLGKFPVVNEDGKKTGEFIQINDDYAGSKVNLCADQVAEIYHATTSIELPGVEGRYNLVQLIFLDFLDPQTRRMDRLRGLTAEADRTRGQGR